MRRLLKFLLVLVVAAAVGMAVFLLTFDVNRYKGELTALLARQTGRSVAVNGDIGFAFSLVPTVAVEEVRLGNAAWGEAADLAAIERVEARVALKPLLDRRIEIRSIAVHGATLNLERNAEGEGNWSLRPAGSAAQNSRTTPPVFSDLAVDRIVVEKSTIGYRDSRGAHELAIDTFTADGSAPSSPVSLQLRGTWLGHPVTLDGSVGALHTLAANGNWPLDLSGSIAELKFTVKGNIERPLDEPSVSVAVAVSAPTLRDAGKLAAMELPALSPFSLTATLTTDQQRYELRDLEAQAGRSDVTGTVTVNRATTTPGFAGELNAVLVDLTEMLPPPAEQRGRMFSTEALFPATLPKVNGRLALRAAEVRTHKMNLAHTTGDVSLNEGELQVSALHAQAAGGDIDGGFVLRSQAKTPQVKFDLRGKGILPAQLPQFKGKRLTGAPTDFTFAIEGRGASIAEVMGSGSGRILVKMGAGRIPNNLATADLLFDAVHLLNPLAATDPTTAIECVVLNLGVKNGVASTQNGIAVRTAKLTVLGGGVVDLKTERIDIGVQPKPREGTGLNVVSLSGDLVRVGGTLSDPHPVADAEGVAGAGLKLGAAVATGGLSLLAEGLYDRATAEEDVCAIALGGASRSQPSRSAAVQAEPQKEKSVIEKTTDTTREVVKDTGEAVQGVFRKIFDR